MRRNDPFQNNDPRFEPYSLPDDGDQFSQPDPTPSTLKSWLRSDEIQKELGQLPQRPARAVVQFVDTPSGLQLHITRGDITKIYTGPKSELEKIARAAS